MGETKDTYQSRDRVESSVAQDALKEADINLERAMTVVEDRHLDAVTEDLEANPTVKHAGPSDDVLHEVETKVIESRKNDGTAALPTEAQDFF